MPTYDYRCPSGHDFEHFFRKISDATDEVSCPTCGATAVRRVSGGAGLVFKGSGFYLTDYGKNAHRKSGSDGSKGEGDSGSGGGGESKSDAAKSDAAKSDGAASSTSAPPAGKSESSTKSSDGTAASTRSKKGGDTK